jgi:LAS superfamily LD-carboxypeptidase LdcB
MTISRFNGRHDRQKAQGVVDVEGYCHHDTGHAILFSSDGTKENAVWLPRTQCEWEPKRTGSLTGYGVATVARWLARDRGLV